MRRIALVFVFILSTALLGQEVDYGPKHISPTREVVTPHIKWLSPYSKGPLSILFLTHRGGMREIVELAQRMDIHYTVFAIHSPDVFYERDPANPSTLTPESMTADGENKLGSSYDVIVLGNINWNALPLSIRYLVLKKVKEGTSLLGIIRGRDEYLNRALERKISPDFSFLFPYKGLSHFEKYDDFNTFLNSTLDVYQFGEGKIFLLKGYDVPYRMQILTPSPSGNPLDVKYLEYDYYLAYISHLLLIVSGKEPEVQIKAPDFLSLNRDDFSSLLFTLESKANIKASCSFIIRSKDNEVFSTQTRDISLSPGENKLNFSFNKLPAGEYFADLWVSTQGKVMNFGSTFIRLSSNITISSIDMKNVLKKGEPVSGKITLENEMENWKGFALWIAQRDNFGRITAMKEMDLSSSPPTRRIEISFSLPRTKPLSVLQYLDVILCKRQKGIDLLDSKSKVFFISDLYPKDDIRHILWVGAFGSYLTPYFYRELFKEGIDTQYTGFSEAVLLGNLYHLPYATRFIDRKTDWYPHPDVPDRTKDDHIRLPCLNDPSYLEQVRNDLTKIAEHLKQFSTREFSMGDECHFVGGNYELCFCPYCVSGFAKFLQKEYGTIENLNREYEGDYKSFEDVKPLTLEDVRESPKFAPLWVDYRRYMEDVWAGIYKFSRSIIENVVPEAKVGYEGSDMSVNSFNAADFYKLMQSMNLNNTYDASFIPYAVSHFSRPGSLLGLGWYGGYNPCRSELYNRYIPWRHLFRGANSFWIWHGEPGMEGGVVAPDLSFYDFFKANIEEVKELKKGIGKLIMNAKREAEVAILYSASSVHSSTLTEGLPPMEQILNALVALLEDIRCSFKIISYKQLEEGILEKEGFRLLILPYTQAISVKEAEAIKKFLQGGGKVVADLRPGVHDEHGKPYPQGILDELFGVRQEASPQPKRGKVSLRMGKDFPQNLPDAFCDFSLKVTNGQAQGESEGVPCLILKEYGKGTALLLNFSLSAYSATSESATTWKAFFKSLLNLLGIEEKVKVFPDLEGLRTYWFRSGQLRYLGILQEPPEGWMDYATGKAKPLKPSLVKLTFPKKYHIYDVREGKYLGYSDTISTSVEPGRAKLYSLLPYKVETITLDIPKKVHPGGELPYEIKIKGSSSLLGLHILRLSLISPKGEELPYYSENLAIVGGKIKDNIPLAINEEAGKWRFKVKDTASGISAERTFTVETM